MSRIIIVSASVIGIVILVTPVLSWEFHLKGELEYRLCYVGRTGDRDLFGIASLQDASANFVGFAGPNIWGTGDSWSVPASNPLPEALGGAGVGITRGGYSRYGSDALINDVRLTLFPSVQVNRAIWLSGVVNFGGMRTNSLSAIFFPEILMTQSGHLHSRDTIQSPSAPAQRTRRSYQALSRLEHYSSFRGEP